MANPDLASVLSTLSALSNTPTSTPTPVQPEAGISHEDDYEPPEIPPTPSALAPTPVPAPSAAPAQPPHTPNTNTDPTTITTWPPALRHIMQTISDQSKSQSQSQSQSPSQQLQTRVRRLLHSQHEHERQWWEGRQALCRKLGDRVERGREVDEVLRAVGAPVSSHNTGISPEQNTIELTTYDKKIHAAATQMADAMALELRGLRVPFFSLRRDLILADDRGRELDKGLDKGQRDGRISRGELAVLQRRMLELLQDLCRD